MKWLLTVLTAGALLLAALAVWVRIAPSDPAIWHQIPQTVPRRHAANSDLREIAGSLAALDEVIRATPRTRVLAGAVGEGMVTYVTRSAVFGFPDYTTLRQDGGRLTVFARSRFGKSDLGVNAARVDGWLMALGQGGG